jgi:hypothetical protein
MAEAVGVSPDTVHRVWRENGLKADLVRKFKLSNDPRFVEKLADVVGLYMNPPEHALVLCVDEKSQIQALDRTQPGLPLKRGRAQTTIHTYIEAHNDDPKPFVWTATVKSILEKVNRCRAISRTAH